MKILITGGAGFIGSQIGHHLEENGHYVVLLDNMSYGHEDNLTVDGKKVGEFIHADVRDKDIGQHLEGVDAVIHMAGIAPLPDCQLNPSKTIDNNVTGTANMLEACRKKGIKKFIFASTSAIYENCKITPFVEDRLESNPDLVYAVSKLQCESLCKAYASTYKMDVITLRFFNVYGPHQDFRRKHPPLMGYITKCLLQGEKPTFFSSGDQKRDYVYISDLVDLVEMCLKRSDVPGEIFNVSSGTAYSVKEIYKIFCESFGTYIEPSFESAEKFWDKYPELFSGPLPLPQERVVSEVNKFSLGSSKKVENILGWKTKVGLVKGVEAVVEYAKSQIDSKETK